MGEKTEETAAQKPPGAFRGLLSRSTADLLVLLIAGTISFTVLGAMIALAVIEVIHPEQDTSLFASGISDVITTLIGLLAGFLAGRTASTVEDQRKPQEE